MLLGGSCPGFNALMQTLWWARLWSPHTSSRMIGTANGNVGVLAYHWRFMHHEKPREGTASGPHLM